MVVHSETRQHMPLILISDLLRSDLGRKETHCSLLLNAILARGVSCDDSYRIVECSSCLRSNARNEPSAPTDTKISGD